MMILRRKEIIAAALVVLIGMAGYLNWSYQDTVRVRDGESYIEAGKKFGEAQLVNSDANSSPEIDSVLSKEPKSSEADKATDTDNAKKTEAPSSSPKTDNSASANTDYFENAKLEKQTARAKALEILNDTATNESFDKEIRKKAQQQILDTAELSEKEAAVENIAKAKGYHNICVFMNDDTVNITVKHDNFSETDVVRLQEIAQEQLKISANNIKVVEIK